MEFQAVQLMRVSTFWKTNNILRKGWCGGNGFHLFQFCSKPREPIPTTSVPTRSTPWAQYLTKKVTLKARFSCLHETCGWRLLQMDTCWRISCDSEDVMVPSSFPVTPDSPLLSYLLYQKRLCKLQEGSVELVQSTSFSCVHSASAKQKPLFHEIPVKGQMQARPDGNW